MFLSADEELEFDSLHAAGGTAGLDWGMKSLQGQRSALMSAESSGVFKTKKPQSKEN